MKFIVYNLLLVLVIAPSAHAESKNQWEYSKLTSLAGLSPEQRLERQQLLRSMLDTSDGRARVTARWATSFLGLRSEYLNNILELSPWFAEIAKRIKSENGYRSAEEKARKCLPPGESMCLLFSLSQNGQLSERKSRIDNIRPMDVLPSRRVLRERLLKLINDATPFVDPPNILPVQGGLLFEFYMSDNDHLEFTVMAMPGDAGFPLRNNKESLSKSPILESNK